MDAIEARKITEDTINKWTLDIDKFIDERYDQLINHLKHLASCGLNNFDVAHCRFSHVPYDVRTEVINKVVERLFQNGFRIKTWNYKGWFKNRKPIYTEGFEIKW